jgi:hypothetical protein
MLEPTPETQKHLVFGLRLCWRSFSFVTERGKNILDEHQCPYRKCKERDETNHDSNERRYDLPNSGKHQYIRPEPAGGG